MLFFLQLTPKKKKRFAQIPNPRQRIAKISSNANSKFFILTLLTFSLKKMDTKKLKNEFEDNAGIISFVFITFFSVVKMMKLVVGDKILFKYVVFSVAAILERFFVLSVGNSTYAGQKHCNSRGR